MIKPFTHIVEKVPSKYLTMCGQGAEVWYCHRIGYDYIPVLGSIGSKADAEEACRAYNLDGKAHYGERGRK
jgi:hypothetical protein